MTEKILNHLEVFSDEISYKPFIEKLYAKIMVQKSDIRMKFVFSLFDEDSNGFITASDILNLLMTYGGICTTLMNDVYELISCLQSKQAKQKKKLEKEH